MGRYAVTHTWASFRESDVSDASDEIRRTAEQFGSFLFSEGVTERTQQEIYPHLAGPRVGMRRKG